ncbi:DNA-binding transcriptional LysR family regulator [Duganella sp. 1411]|jgi:DNA-binding transcriptional LysR family regulator|uniref:LysR family transcriptional regulator n=1 Tax=Duganella sp. 1411 TaxID=2806572 RepID=UPI001AEB2E7A|nr:LysR family transcriptional regulator [Duganella sp. 1411]MBP1207381.1 DNA-binding transcriptional LysR family regulator [Duganella sp. 1411]
MDKLMSLSVFVAAVEEGSFAGAARRFNLSPAMAGKHISAIESDLNARLFQRTTRRLSLTDVGRTYYDRCKQILGAFVEANREASAAQGIARGTLRVAAPVTFGAMHLGKVVARYVEEHPEVNVEVLMGDRYIDLLDAGVDVAIRIGRLDDPSLVTRRLAPCRMVVCASPKYLERHGTPRTPQDLLQTPRLAFSEAVSAGDWTFIDETGRSYVVDGPCRVTANNTQMLLACALAGAGLAYGPTFVFGEHIQRGELVALLPAYRTTELTIQAVYPSARSIPVKVRRFVDYLAEAFGNDPVWDRKAWDQHAESRT